MLSILLACSAPTPLVGATLTVDVVGAVKACDLVLAAEGERLAQRTRCDQPVFTALQPGRYELWAEGPGVTSARRSLQLADATAPLVVLPLVGSATVAVEVTGAARVRVTGGDVDVVRDTEHGWMLAEGIPSGAVTITATTPDGAEAVHRGWVSERESLVVRVATRLDPGRPVLGLRFRTTERGHVVSWVHELGPAHGLVRPGDLLVAVEGQSLDGLAWKEAGHALAGEVGEARTVTLSRDGEARSVELAAVGYKELQRRSGVRPSTGQDIP